MKYLSVLAGFGLAWAVQAQAPDVAWPREAKAADGTVVTVYQPQIERWADDTISGRAAVSVARPGEKEPRYGVLELSARIVVDKSADLATLTSVRVTKSSFPGMSDKESQQYLAVLRGAVTRQSWPVSVQALQANLAVTEARSQQKAQAVKNDPPQVLFRTSPTLLVLVDGEPALRPAKDEPSLERVINTTALILKDPASGSYYLWALVRWWEAKAVEGEWKAAAPTRAPLDAARAAVRDQFEPLDGKDANGKALFEPGVTPQIVVATRPTELLQSSGEPKMSPIPGTQLLYVANSSNDIFFELGAQTYYVLISGRWFSGKSLQGPWSHVPGNSLPAEFARIPPDHAAGDVLASVPGTTQAREAAIANQIPQTATVQRDAQPTPVAYDGGAPKWQPIDGTPLSYAPNTASPVIRIDEKTYYMVQNGVWFAATSPAGPWAVAATVPSVIYTIPPSSPLHYVTYVRVYGSTATVVYVGYTPGYYGTVMTSDGVVVYGTGYYYPPYMGAVWYPYPPTYGFGVYVGAGFFIGFGIAVMPPWHYGGCCWYGGPVVIHHGGNLSVNNSYNRWGGKTTNVSGPGGRNLTTTQVGNTKLAKGSGSDNVYAGRDGNVYRREGQGDWQKYDGKGSGWSDVDRPGGERPDRPSGERPSQLPAGERPQQRPAGGGESINSLDRQYQGRQAGDQRAQQYRSGAGGYQGGGMPGGGATRGGGGMRGGGGRR